MKKKRLAYIDYWSHKFTRSGDFLREILSEEFEITDLLNLLAKDKLLDVKKLNRGITWLDMGTVDSLLLASNFIKNIQTTQGFIVGSPEEASWRIGNISTETFLKLCQDGSSEYFKKLSELHLKVK